MTENASRRGGPTGPDQASDRIHRETTQAVAASIRQAVEEHLSATAERTRARGEDPVYLDQGVYEGVVVRWPGGAEALTAFPDDDQPGWWTVTAYDPIEVSTPAVEESVAAAEAAAAVTELLAVAAENAAAQAAAAAWMHQRAPGLQAPDWDDAATADDPEEVRRRLRLLEDRTAGAGSPRASSPTPTVAAAFYEGLLSPEDMQVAEQVHQRLPARDPHHGGEPITATVREDETGERFAVVDGGGWRVIAYLDLTSGVLVVDLDDHPTDRADSGTATKPEPRAGASDVEPVEGGEAGTARRAPTPDRLALAAVVTFNGQARAAVRKH